MSLFNQYRQFKFKIYIMQFICILRVKHFFFKAYFFPRRISQYYIIFLKRFYINRKSFMVYKTVHCYFFSNLFC